MNKEPFGYPSHLAYSARLKELRARSRLIAQAAVFLSFGIAFLVFFGWKLLTPEREAAFPVAVWLLYGAGAAMFLALIGLAVARIRERAQWNALKREFEAEQAALSASRHAKMNR